MLVCTTFEPTHTHPHIHNKAHAILGCMHVDNDNQPDPGWLNASMNGGDLILYSVYKYNCSFYGDRNRYIFGVTLLAFASLDTFFFATINFFFYFFAVCCYFLGAGWFDAYETFLYCIFIIRNNDDSLDSSGPSVCLLRSFMYVAFSLSIKNADFFYDANLCVTFVFFFLSR